jgi:Histidine kinase-, DNA gyrase B-, and HSP90-like ATPase
MKPELDSIRSVSSLNGETQRMSMDENALDHLMSVMTDLYADPKLAVIREYSTNGFDATIDAGSSDPIKVTLPTAAHPNFIVQDFGIGMTTEQVLHVYSQYGNSTKRDSDSVVGMLGLGCKSGLTYASSFLIRTVRNGIETVANVTKNSENIGEIQIIDTRSTDERNGTTITIPIRSSDIYPFTEKANEFYLYWQPGTVLVNGEMPEHFVSNYESGESPYTKVNGPTDTFYSTETKWNPITLVVMGNVAYPVSMDEWTNPLNTGRQGHNVVHFAEIGDVNFAPSREELSYRGKTKTFLSDTLPGILKEEIKWVVSSKMDTATTAHEAFTMAGELRRLSFISVTTPLAWNGKNVPDIHGALGTSNGRGLGHNVYAWNSSPTYGGKNSRIDRNPWISAAGPQVFIHNAPQNLSAAHKYGLREKFPNSIFYFWEITHAANDWVEFHDWKVLKGTLSKPAVVKSVSTGAIDRSSRNFETVDGYGAYTGTYASELSNVVFFPFTPSEKPQQHTLMTATQYGLTPVSVYKADFDEFVRNHNCWTGSMEDYRVKRAAEIDIELWTAHHLARMTNSCFVDALMVSLDSESRVMVKWNKQEDEKLVHVARGERKGMAEAQKIIDLYPLSVSGYGTIQHYQEYIDALYTTRKGI